MKQSNHSKTNALFAGLICLMLTGQVRADLVITELDLANNKMELVNTGDATVDATSWWLCNRVNGSPFYSSLASAGTIDVALSTASSLVVNAGEMLVLDVASGFLPEANGELGLYNSNSFTSAAAIEDYILWGANGVRDSVAQMAGIWNDNESIDVSGVGVGDTIQLVFGMPGNSAAEYVIGPGTLGDFQPDLMISQISIANTTVLSFQSVSGTVYRLEFTPDLVNSNVWLDARFAITGNGEVSYMFDPGAVGGLSPNRFYRIVVPEP